MLRIELTKHLKCTDLQKPRKNAGFSAKYTTFAKVLDICLRIESPHQNCKLRYLHGQGWHARGVALLTYV
jgi:hypothetical protein